MTINDQLIDRNASTNVYYKRAVQSPTEVFLKRRDACMCKILSMLTNLVNANWIYLLMVLNLLLITVVCNV